MLEDKIQNSSLFRLSLGVSKKWRSKTIYKTLNSSDPNFEMLGREDALNRIIHSSTKRCGKQILHDLNFRVPHDAVLDYADLFVTLRDDNIQEFDMGRN